jgi:hypothetical protein
MTGLTFRSWTTSNSHSNARPVMNTTTLLEISPVTNKYKKLMSHNKKKVGSRSGRKLTLEKEQASALDLQDLSPKRDPLAKTLLSKPSLKNLAPNPAINPPMPIQNSFETLGEPSSKKTPSFGPVLEPVSFSPPVLERIEEESGDEETSHEVTQEEEPQEAEESLLKLQSNQDVEEGELPRINPKSLVVDPTEKSEKK